MKNSIYFKIVLEILLLCLIYRHNLAQSTIITPGGASLTNNNSLNTFQFPKLTYEEIKSIPQPQPGAAVYDITTGCVRFYNGSEWPCMSDNKNTPFMTPGALSTILNVGTYGYMISKGYNVNCNDIESDAQNNLYLAGIVSNFTLTGFNSGNSLDDTLNGRPVGYLIKYSSVNQPQWCFSLPGKTIGTSPFTYNDFASTITSFKVIGDAVYVLGHFNQTINVGNNDVAAAGGSDIFIAKLNPSDGSIIWFKKITNGIGNETAVKLLVDANQNIYVSGRYTTNFTLDGTVGLTNNGSTDSFLAKFNSSGSLQNSVSITGNDNDNLADIELTDNEIIAAGTFVNSSNIGITPLTGLSGSNLFIVTFSKQLTVTSAYSINTTGNFCINDIALTTTGNVLVAGRLTGGAQIGSTNYENIGFLANLSSNSNTNNTLIKVSRGDITKLAHISGHTFALLNFTGNTTIDNVPVPATTRGSDVALIKVFCKLSNEPKFKWYQVVGDRDSDFSGYESYSTSSRALFMKSTGEAFFPLEENIYFTEKVIRMNVMKYVE